MDVNVFVKLALCVAIAILSSAVLRCQISFLRLFVAASISASIEVLFFTEELLYLNVAVVSLFVSVCITYDKRIKDTIMFFFVYIAITFFTRFLTAKLSEAFGGKVIPDLIFAMAVLISAGLIEGGAKLFRSYADRQKNLYKVEVIYKEKSCFSEGFYDSGNTAKAENTPIVILSTALAKKIGFEATDSVPVMTVGGVKVLDIAPLKIKLYFDDGSNILYEVWGAVSQLSRSAPLLLNNSMRR